MARWLFEIPGLEFALHAGRKSSLAPRSENTYLIPTNVALTGCEVKGSSKIFTLEIETCNVENIISKIVHIFKVQLLFTHHQSVYNICVFI